jgi:hypothetical protein
MIRRPAVQLQNGSEVEMERILAYYNTKIPGDRRDPTRFKSLNRKSRRLGPSARHAAQAAPHGLSAIAMETVR